MDTQHNRRRRSSCEANPSHGAWKACSFVLLWADQIAAVDDTEHPFEGAECVAGWGYGVRHIRAYLQRRTG